MPPSPSVGHPGLPDPGHVVDIPIKYTHNSNDNGNGATTTSAYYSCVIANINAVTSKEVTEAEGVELG
jgi:hypothetical protein